MSDNGEMKELKCISCALKHDTDPEDEWVEPGIYVINGQGVCEKHIGAPYHFPEHGFGGMQARYRALQFDQGQHEPSP